MPNRRPPLTQSPTAELAALQATIAGDVVSREDTAYETLRAPAVAHAKDVRPLAIVKCRTTEDIVQALAVARRLGAPVAPRSGGHCFAGRSTTTGILFDVSPMDAVAVAGEVAQVGAGVRLGALYDALDRAGRTVPAGCGPTVGIAGLSLGGGIGVLGRSHGLTCDRLVAAEVVLADGRVVFCDAEHHADLFWALRGAGGGQFGVVTSLWLRTVPAPMTTTFHLQWRACDATAAITAWQRWAPDAPDASDVTLRVVASGDTDEPLTVHLVGAIHEPKADAERLLGDLVVRVGADPHRTLVREAGFREGKAWLAGRGDDPDDDAAVPVLTSELFDRDLPSELAASLLNHLIAGRDRFTRHMAFTPLGGAYNRVPAAATAFAHRSQRFILEHGTSAPVAELGNGRAWARRAWASAHRVGSGRVYPNFPDPGLIDAVSAYHRENLVGLREVKRRYDPDRTFRFHQSL